MVRQRDHGRWRFGNTVVLPAILLVLAVTAFTAWGVRSAAGQSDSLSVERQAREVTLAIGAAEDELAQSQTGVAIWNLLLLELRKKPPNWDWIDNNVGIWLNYVFAHQCDFILDGRDHPIYAMIGGRRASPDRFAAFAPALAPLVDAVRGRSTRPANTHERLPGQPLNPQSTVRSGPKAIHATDLASIGGRLAVVSIMRMIPDTPQVADTPGRQPLLVSVRYLDADFARNLSQVQLISGAHTAPTAVLKPGERSIPLVSSRGQLLGVMIWRPELPGSALLRSMEPVAVLAVSVLAFALILMAARVARLMEKDARSLRLLEVAHDELKAKEAQAYHLAYHDILTDLPNRALFNDTVDRTLMEAEEAGPCAVMLLDLDRFKQVNDTLGHLAGDLLIREVAARLRNVVHPRGLAARIGGDEFAIVLNAPCDEADIARLAALMVDALRRPFEILRSTVWIGGSIGVAVRTEPDVDRSELMRRADIAMYEAKRQGGSGWRFFAPAMLDDRVAAAAAAPGSELMD